MRYLIVNQSALSNHKVRMQLWILKSSFSKNEYKVPYYLPFPLSVPESSYYLGKLM
jgi:hypothetical protein